jgi:ubiquinone/menaquinone biosynthesis C-methylase UbiE
MDWGVGDYELIAEQLLPAAREAIAAAAPTREELLLDVGCGTGNAALLAAETGARVLGVDPSPRLIELARESAYRRGLQANFELGEAAALPLAEGAADVVVSVFGAVFAPDAGAAAREIARVCAPHGRVVLCAWLPEGALFEVARLRREAVSRTNGAGAGHSAPFAWHDLEALRGMFSAHGFTVALAEHEIEFTAPSCEEFVEQELRHHPLWVAAREQLGESAIETLRERVIATYAAANRSPDGFALASRYVVASLRRGAPAGA